MMFAMANELIKINGEADLNGTKIKVIEGGFGEGNKAILFSDVAKKHEVEPKSINQLNHYLYIFQCLILLIYLYI